MRAIHANLSDAKGLTFACLPGCGFCCTASPLVLPEEAPALRGRAVPAPDGTLRLPMLRHACGALDAERRCGVYEARPSVCRVYPYAVHAGRRIQVTVTLACPGITGGAEGEPAQAGAARAAELALSRPGAAQMAARAKETFTQFDARMKEWGVAASADKLRAALLPHAQSLARPAMLPAFFAGLAQGDLHADARAVGALFDTPTDADLADLLREGATEAFDEPETVLWVEPDFAWTRAQATGDAVVLRRGAAERAVAVDDVPVDWDDAAHDALAAYLTRLLHRDHAEGAAAWVVDASGYQATPAAAYARVLGEASLQVALRAGLLAAEAGRDEIDAAFARRGIAAYETAFHSLPTLGAIL